MPCLAPKAPLGFFFVVEVFVDAAFVAFDIKAFADYFDES